MSDLPVRITMNGNSSRIVVDGVNISQHVRAVHVHASAETHAPAVVMLELIHVDVAIDGVADVLRVIRGDDK